MRLGGSSSTPMAYPMLVGLSFEETIEFESLDSAP
jgi:hypothetical protein